MTCPKSGDVTAFVKGELPEAERGHFESCPTCSAEAARTRSVLSRVAAIETVEPSPDFVRRVVREFSKAHPEPGVTWWEALRFRLGFAPAWAVSVAVHVAVLAVATILFLAPPPAPDPDREHITTVILPMLPPEAERAPRFAGPWSPDRWQRQLKSPASSFARLEGRTTRGGAVGSALGWLAARQEPSGCWRDGKSGSPVELTGLTVLAFLGEGHTHRAGDFRKVVERGLTWLVHQQTVDGRVGDGHALGSLALLEAWLMTKDESLEIPASSAVGHTVTASMEADPAATAWMALALRLSFANGNATVIPALNMMRRRLEQAGSVEASACLARLMASPVADGALRDVRLTPPAEDLEAAYFASLAAFQIRGSVDAEGASQRVRTQSPDGSWGGIVRATALQILILEAPYRYPRLHG